MMSAYRCDFSYLYGSTVRRLSLYDVILPAQFAAEISVLFREYQMSLQGAGKVRIKFGI